MAHKKKQSLLEEYHDFLISEYPTLLEEFIIKVCEDVGISISSYYRKIKAPQCFNNAEQIAIAKAAKMPLHFLFP